MQVLINVRMDGMKVPLNYVADFSQAELAFMHQRIYDPSERRLVPLNPFPDEGLSEKDEKWIGLCVSA